MSTRDAWENATLDLIHRLESDRLRKAEQRLAAAERAVSTVRAEIDALHLALKVYRSEHGIPFEEIVPPSAQQAAEYHGMGAREMMQRWADSHAGQVVMKEAARFLAAAGLFRDEVQAAGALYPAVRRAEDFEKVARGVYRRRVQSTAPLEVALLAANITDEDDEDETPAPPTAEGQAWLDALDQIERNFGRHGEDAAEEAREMSVSPT